LGDVDACGRKCLVVDDSRVLRRMARRILEAHGFCVDEAADGGAALEACRRRLPACVLLDWKMPVMDGIEFLKALRREFGPDRPAVVFCTTRNEAAFIERALAHGAQEFILKPFDAGILVGKLAQAGMC
jgi:two-component system, chemotaxis family, chemotaxis protein CheY